ncbi:flagellar biosynthesis protein FlhF [Falsibacillus pallidus]|uniref:Flagellar biosynthesis protein FlhF n=1 Tax=Falsibacillus pallidus TaxID=493781 RepID=A0A370GW08_9BACI|nr:flagellar biosynthesis protein FlhF [Falsibacillus pallidus]RDI47440.1 flagellar biosynthesis protein FlhF [Falsibacillus pallidus]
MKVKKYIAPSMNEAMNKVRLDLGDEAVILNSKLVYSGGFLGLFKKKNIEVIAAVDPNTATTPIEAKGRLEKVERRPKKADQAIQPTPEKTSIMEKEMEELKNMILKLSSQSMPEINQYPEDIRIILSQLYTQEIEGEIVSKLGDSLLHNWRETKDAVTRERIIEWTKVKLMEEISSVEFGGISYTKKFINVIGPTGVGKTTTLAKIAANAVLNNKKKIAFITTDTYRIAAIEQLKTYGNLLNVPVEVVYKLADFKQAVEKFKDYDLIFIDTAGRNYQDEKYVKELREVIDFDSEMETFLVLTMTAKQRDLENMINQFKTIPIDKFIFTKLDETSSYGMMINLIKKYEIGGAYLTMGQDVPDDIVEADPIRIIDYVIEGNRP